MDLIVARPFICITAHTNAIKADHLTEVQGTYKLSEYFAKPYFHKY
jgi:hypothetical protein